MREIQPGEPLQAGETEVVLTNTTAHVLHVPLKGGAFITVPPTASGPVRFALSATEHAAYTKVIATPAVVAWIDAGELVIGAAEPPPTPPPAEPPPEEEI